MAEGVPAGADGGRGGGDFRAHLIRYGGDAYHEIVEKAQGCYVFCLDPLDTEAPEGTLAIGNGGAYSANRTLVVYLLGTPIDVEAVALALDQALVCAGATYTPASNFLTATFASDGPHSVAVCLRDRAGNLSEPLTGSVTVVQTPPSAPTVVLSASGGDPGSTTRLTGPTSALTSSAVISSR